jgi:hypothetical protein
MDADRRDSFASLQDLLKKKPRSAPGERCDYCSVPLDSEHSHLIDLKSRRILCSCRPCYIVFQPQGAAQGRYKPVPSRYAEVEGFSVGDGEWDSLQIPIGLAFFFFNSIENKMVAFYPGPAGATESLLSLDAWETMAARHPLFATLEADVEAILIHRSRTANRCLIVPIDAAYELVGLMRTSWRGFDGGEEAWKRIDAFFSKISERAQGRVTARLS